MKKQTNRDKAKDRLKPKTMAGSAVESNLPATNSIQRTEVKKSKARQVPKSKVLKRRRKPAKHHNKIKGVLSLFAVRVLGAVGELVARNLTKS